MGSLRRGSYNRALMASVQTMLPEGTTLEWANIEAIPFYHGDVEAAGMPPSVDRFAEQLASCDGLLIATPEYNHSVPGVLKNALDWASRHPSKPLAGKPTAIMGASPGVVGTARAQDHLRLIASTLDLRVMNKPEVLVGSAHTRFDEGGTLVDASTKAFLQTFADAFAAWVHATRQA